VIGHSASIGLQQDTTGTAGLAETDNVHNNAHEPMDDPGKGSWE
jgi:hypothetical protein